MADSRTDQAASSRHAFLDRPDMLVVLRPPHGTGPEQEEPAAASPDPATAGFDLFLAIDADGMATGFNGHVDLGTGIRTALTQIVAEELDLPIERVAMVLGDTSSTPNQGATIASETIQVTAIPLRRAAASARQFLLARASDVLGLPVADLYVEDGVVMPRAGKGSAASDRRVAYGDLVRGRQDRILLDDDVALKPVADYRIIGRSTARIDIPAKATGTWTYVHDVRVPGMVHGRVVRPPYAGIDTGPHVGTSLLAVDEASVADIPGLLAIVVIGDFVGVVATREEDAAEAARRLGVRWKPTPPLPNLESPEAALRANPSKPRELLNRGDVDRAIAAAQTAMPRTYVWPYQMHGSIGPSCSVADYRDDGLVVWSGTQNPYLLRADLARLLDLPDYAIAVHRLEAAGCYGRNCADDVGADAALLSRAVKRPVRVQLTREQEHAWEPKGAAQVMDVRGGLDEAGGPAGYDFATRYPSNGAPTLALLLTGTIPPVAAVFEMGDRTAVPPYAYGHARVTVHDMPPIVRASWFRGVSALPNTFAHESYIDELAAAAHVDPIDYRLRYLGDSRGATLVRAVAERAGWQARTRFGTAGGEGDLLYGRGFAYAVYTHGTFPGTGAAWAAWVADVAVDTKTGVVAVTKVVVGQDSGLMINPDGVRHQIHGNVIQSTSRVLKEEVSFEHGAIASREWGAYPIITFPEVPAIDVLMLDRPDAPPLGAGESASVPSAAAIANALYDATGVRFRELPLTPERVLAGLGGGSLAPPATPVSGKAAGRRRRWLGGFLATLTAVASAGLGLAATALPLRPAFAPIDPPDANLFSAATLARGRLVAAAGACNVCHVGGKFMGLEGQAFAGGRALETPFGTVYATNITPDPDAGIGRWSYPAFERAMRAGIARDGHHLYPAHPYPSFAKASEADLEALYGYLMTQTPVAVRAPVTALRFPFGLRGLMAGWNSLFLDTRPWRADAKRSDAWNRGAYLVEGLGHCGACHSPRNALGAERRGAARLSGGVADGWDAPALNTLSAAPIRWDEDAFTAYLRHGHAAQHGSAAGPMADVIKALAPLPDSDIRAMAVYLASLNEAAATPVDAGRAAALVAAADAATAQTSRAARLFTGACATCHSGASSLTSLALNTNLHSARPDNLVQAILNGIPGAALHRTASAIDADLGSMPPFRDSLGDVQIAELAAYLRSRFAADKPAWADLEDTVARLRVATPHA